jgi:hypothetical protein
MKPILLCLLILTLTALACTGTLTGITGAPVFVCPTPIYNTPVPLPTLVPIPGYPTFVPFPTALPPPTVTPYAIRPPAAFYRGDAVFTRSPQSTRFRLTNIYTVNTPAGRTVAVWQLEIRNLSGGTYDVFPAYQSYISQLVGGTTGTWGASSDAAVDAGLSVTYEAVGLAPGATGTFILAAFIPYGTAAAPAGNERARLAHRNQSVLCWHDCRTARWRAAASIERNDECQSLTMC